MPRSTSRHSSSPSADDVVEMLRQIASPSVRDGLKRYAIPSDRAFGVPVGSIRDLGKKLGRDHELALALWKTEWYEARMLATFVDDPAQVTLVQMDQWCKDFDSWAICDTACFHLFDRTLHAWKKVRQWSTRKNEFEKRAAFALLASIALHDKKADDDLFLETIPLMDRAADDDRNFVKKAVSWAIREIGRRNALLNAAAMELAESLASSDVAARRWIGKDARRDLAKGPKKRSK